MSTFIGLPVVGIDSSGNQINLLTKSDGTTLATTNHCAANFKSDIWESTQINVLAKDDSGTILGIGSGVNNGQTVSLFWMYSGGKWKIGKNGFTGDTRPYGVEGASSWYVSDRKSVINSDMKVKSPMPAGGLSPLSPTFTTASTDAIDSLNRNGSTIIGSSYDTIGTWLSSNSWIHSPGPATKLATGRFETTYTFPGYTGANAQVQYANTVVSSANVASYGLMGPTVSSGPQISVTWPA
jgi:hypothetical protein